MPPRARRSSRRQREALLRAAEQREGTRLRQVEQRRLGKRESRSEHLAALAGERERSLAVPVLRVGAEEMCPVPGEAVLAGLEGAERCLRVPFGRGRRRLVEKWVRKSSSAVLAWPVCAWARPSSSAAVSSWNVGTIA